MASWLALWDEPAAAAEEMVDVDASPGATWPPGVVSDEEMVRLEAAGGTDFDRFFLQLMAAHHAAAVEMAKSEQTDGANPHALALARSIERSHTAEMDEMAQLTRGL